MTLKQSGNGLKGRSHENESDLPGVYTRRATRTRRSDDLSCAVSFYGAKGRYNAMAEDRIIYSASDTISDIACMDTELFYGSTMGRYA